MTAPMMAITLWPEWAHGVAWLDKRIENRNGRPWARLVGQRIAIHAGTYIGGRKGGPATLEGLEAVALTAPEDLGVRFGSLPPRFRLGEAERPIVTSAIVCTAVLSRVEHNKDHARLFVVGRVVPPWANPESRFWWHLTDVVVLPVPVPCKGHQSFWPAPSLEGGTQ